MERMDRDMPPLTVALHSPMPTGPRRLVRTHSISSTSPGITFRRKRAFFTPPNRAILPWFSGRERMATAPTWAMASKISTPGMTCSWGKWPQKNCSLTLTHLRPLAHWPGS